ncbi:sarcocystatin-A-like [Haematobia irritans]|uniref:sarcocystatin-A-like n=1 Tax=Haematobia irritans TaxID=7368 RepID=UPI003F4F4F00
MNRIFLFTLSLAVVCIVINAQPSEPKLKLLGSVEQLEGPKKKEAVDVLENSLKKIAAGEKGPHYELDKVHTAFKQRVAGLLYKINADIIDNDNEEKSKNCNIEIWSRPWLENGIQVTLKCNEEDELVFSHSA